MPRREKKRGKGREEGGKEGGCRRWERVKGITGRLEQALPHEGPTRGEARARGPRKQQNVFEPWEDKGAALPSVPGKDTRGQSWGAARCR